MRVPARVNRVASTPPSRSLDQVDEALCHKLANVAIVAVFHAVDVAHRSYAPIHGNLSAPRGRYESTKTREVCFRALLNDSDAELSLSIV